MWEIELSKRDDFLETIKYHSTFTSVGKVLSFILTPKSKAFKGIEINFITKRDKDKKPYFIELEDINDGDLNIIYYNPSVGLSGLKEPMIILENKLYFFKVMFNTNFLTDSDTYLLSIEFFIEKK